MDKAIELLEKQVQVNTAEMKIIAFEYIRSENLLERKKKKITFKQLEQQNLSLEKAIDKLLFLEV